MKRVLVFVLIPLVLISAAWALFYKFEGTKPVVDIKLPSVYLNRSYEMAIDITDAKTGLRNIQVSIMQQGREKILLDKEYKAAGFLGLFTDPKTKSDSFIIPVESWKYGLSDGDAIIRVKVSDRSWRGLNKGNIFYVEKNVVVDSKPPQVKVLTKRHNIERGGTALVIYQLFEKNIKSGIKVGENFFPGYPGLFKDPQIHSGFFALDYTQGPSTQINVVAEDLAGNITERGFHTYIRDKKFKTDILNISKGFLNDKIPGFDIGSKESRFTESKNPLLDKFIYINTQVRKQNMDTVLSIPAGTENQKYWDDRFLRLSGSQKKAGFADHRIYNYNGREIDRAVHLGMDLASTSNAGVQAANSGRVIFTGDVGIFGNTIIIDHGFGVSSLYAHLNEILVHKEDIVNIGKTIAYTGETGLAGGDHLHFSMIVHNVFVNPVEWWDRSWIKNNITSKIEEVNQMPKH
ncbi:MAG: M23 family metallopeptidase [Pseudomonadota bacterium]